MSNFIKTPAMDRATDVLNLSKWGQIKLSIFPDEVLDYATKALHNSSDVNDHFAWYFAICLKYCALHKLDLDWQLFYSLSEIHSLPDDAKWVVGAPRLRPPSTGSSHNYQQPAVKSGAYATFKGHTEVDNKEQRQADARRKNEEYFARFSPEVAEQKRSLAREYLNILGITRPA